MPIPFDPKKGWIQYGDVCMNHFGNVRWYFIFFGDSEVGPEGQSCWGICSQPILSTTADSLLGWIFEYNGEVEGERKRNDVSRVVGSVYNPEEVWLSEKRDGPSETRNPGWFLIIRRISNGWHTKDDYLIIFLSIIFTQKCIFFLTCHFECDAWFPQPRISLPSRDLLPMWLWTPRTTPSTRSSSPAILWSWRATFSAAAVFPRLWLFHFPTILDHLYFPTLFLFFCIPMVCVQFEWIKNRSPVGFI